MSAALGFPPSLQTTRLLQAKFFHAKPRPQGLTLLLCLIDRQSGSLLHKGAP